MAKSYTPVFASLLLLILSSCQSIEQISIDYLEPADLSFPPLLRKVAVVNNTSATPDNQLILRAEKTEEDGPVVSHATAYANGDTKIATESLAEEIAQQNYFDEVVICDSALRANDKFARESMLSQEEVRQLTSDLGVDFIIAIENLQIKATKTIRYIPVWNCYQGAMDAQVYPIVRVYLPERSKPIATFQPNDSVFWEDFGGSIAEATTRVIPVEEMLKEAAEFAGTVPVKNLVPIWKTGKRYLFTGGSAQMRDAAIYARKDSWDDAYPLWHQVFEDTKSEKKKMQAAYNIAVYYEIKDSLAKAEEWAITAQEFAKKIDKLDKVQNGTHVEIVNVPNFYLTTLYVNELKERNVQLPKIKAQMNRFNDDF